MDSDVSTLFFSTCLLSAAQCLQRSEWWRFAPFSLFV
jgi:hypothetical protein